MWSFVYRILIHFGVSTPRQFKKIFLHAFFRTWWVRQVLSRKGECKNCGKCCAGCAWLVERDGKFFCRDFANRPCMVFPLTEEEKQKVNPDCGYYWENDKR